MENFFSRSMRNPFQKIIVLNYFDGFLTGLAHSQNLNYYLIRPIAWDLESDKEMRIYALILDKNKWFNIAKEVYFKDISSLELYSSLWFWPKVEYLKLNHNEKKIEKSLFKFVQKTIKPISWLCLTKNFESEEVYFIKPTNDLIPSIQKILKGKDLEFIEETQKWLPLFTMYDTA